MNHKMQKVLSLCHTNNYAVSSRLSDTLCFVCVDENMAVIGNTLCHMIFRIHSIGDLETLFIVQS